MEAASIPTVRVWSLPSCHFLWVSGDTSFPGARELNLYFAEDFPAHKSSLVAAEEGDQAARVSSPLCKLQAGLVLFP